MSSSNLQKESAIHPFALKERDRDRPSVMWKVRTNQSPPESNPDSKADKWRQIEKTRETFVLMDGRGSANFYFTPGYRRAKFSPPYAAGLQPLLFYYRGLCW